MLRVLYVTMPNERSTHLLLEDRISAMRAWNIELVPVVLSGSESQMRDLLVGRADEDGVAGAILVGARTLPAAGQAHLHARMRIVLDSITEPPALATPEVRAMAQGLTGAVAYTEDDYTLLKRVVARTEILPVPVPLVPVEHRSPFEEGGGDDDISLVYLPGGTASISLKEGTPPVGLVGRMRDQGCLTVLKTVAREFGAGVYTPVMCVGTHTWSPVMLQSRQAWSAYVVSAPDEGPDLYSPALRARGLPVLTVRRGDPMDQLEQDVARLVRLQVAGRLHTQDPIRWEEERVACPDRMKHSRASARNGVALWAEYMHRTLLLMQKTKRTQSSSPEASC